MKSKIIGFIILAGIIIAAVSYKFFSENKSSFSGNYSSKPKILEVTSISGYKLDKITIDGEEIPLIKIPLVTWGGYAALIAANNGIKPNKDSQFYKNGKFVVELYQEESSQNHLTGFANGSNPIIWATMDMLPILYDVLKADKRVIPQVVGIFDWSFGGDGIIVRDSIKTPKDLKGKKIVTAGNTPSHFFLMWVLAQSNIQPSEVMIKYVDDAVLAKDAYSSDDSIDACITWSPFIYEITDSKSSSFVKGSKLLITSKDANQLIADCYITRNDFLKEHPEIIEAFSKSMMEGFDLYNANKQKVYNDMAALFKLRDGAHEASLMMGDVHLANFPENIMFFDLENPISAYKVFFLSQEYYKNIGTLSADFSSDAEMLINIKHFEKFKAAGLFAAQQNTIKNSFNKDSNFNIADLESKRVVLTEDLQIYFEPQQISFDANSMKEEIQKNKAYLKQISEQMEILGTTIVKLVGHLDTTKVEEYKSQGQQYYLEASAQAKLVSKRRAEFVKTVLVETYKCDPQRIITEGKGWDIPIDPTDQTKNRRVEIKFLSFE